MPKKEAKSKKPAWAQALDDHVRLSRGPSWTEIASSKPLSMSDGALRHWRNGTREPSISQFLALCKAVKADPSTILLDPSDEQKRSLLVCYDGLESQERRDQLTGTAARLFQEEILERKKKKTKVVPS